MTKTVQPTAAMIETFKAQCVTFGAKVRVRQLSGSLRNAIRVALIEGEKEFVRDAAVVGNMFATSGCAATDKNFRFSWNGDEINLYFAE